MERFEALFGIAGICFFAFAFVAMGIGSIGARGLEVDTIETMAQNVVPEFRELGQTYPEQFHKTYGWSEADYRAKAVAAVRERITRELAVDAATSTAALDSAGLSVSSLTRSLGERFKTERFRARDAETVADILGPLTEACTAAGVQAPSQEAFVESVNAAVVEYVANQVVDYSLLEPLATLVGPITSYRLTADLLVDAAAAALDREFSAAERASARMIDDLVEHKVVDSLPGSFAVALEAGRDAYVAEACWHCHSQFIRPVGNEYLRFGDVATANEGQNELQMPVLYGTRRVGPDLSREGGKRPNGWHIAHFWEPMEVVPTSVMPSFAWFFEESGRYEVRNGRLETIAMFDDEASASAEARKQTARTYTVSEEGGSWRVIDSYTERPTELKYPTEESATEAAAELVAATKASGPFTVRAEQVPNDRGLAIVAYIQWLGTWTGEPSESETEASSTEE